MLLEDKGVLRHGQPVQTDAGPGVVTSGTYSPTLQRVLVWFASQWAPVQNVQSTFGEPEKARLVRPPFVRKGKILVN